jgi:hypothetical protein
MSSDPTVARSDRTEDASEDPHFAFCDECERVFENEDLLELHREQAHDYDTTKSWLKMDEAPLRATTTRYRTGCGATTI